MESEITNLRKCLLIIANEIKRICEKNGIKYFLIGGTYLGAVRHKGFIPWDDDMDLGMLRDDYEKFLKIAGDELDDRFFISSMESEADYGLAFIKVRLNGTRFYETANPEILHSGIFVDIFPLDRFPDNKISRIIQLNQIKLYKNALFYKCGYKYPYSNRSVIGMTLVKYISKKDKKKISKKLTDVLTRYNSRKTKLYFDISDGYYPEQSLHTLENATFEDEEFPIPGNVDETLSLIYGEWRKLPPEEERVFCHVSGEIDFGEYGI